MLCAGVTELLVYPILLRQHRLPQTACVMHAKLPLPLELLELLVRLQKTHMQPRTKLIDELCIAEGAHTGATATRYRDYVSIRIEAHGFAGLQDPLCWAPAPKIRGDMPEEDSMIQCAQLLQDSTNKRCSEELNAKAAWAIRD